jgi:2-enoate reductase
MEAARVAALRGHEVTLFERRDRLGGALIEASVPEFKSDLRPLIDYLSNQLKRLKVRVNLKKEITAKEITDKAPDAVILSTGSKASMPEVPGIQKPIVVDGLDIYRGKEVGKTVIIIGGGMLGSELAHFLAEKGKKVILTTRQAQIGYDMEIAHFIVLIDKLMKAGIQIHTQKLLQEVTDDGVLMLDLARLGEKLSLKGDNVIIMGGLQPDAALYQALKDQGLAVYAIGDCIQPRGIHEAIYEGHLAARSI